MSQMAPDPFPEESNSGELPPTQPTPTSAPPRNRAAWQSGVANWTHQSQKATVKWLYDAGGWLFGALTATSLILLLDLILIGPDGPAALVAGLAVAIALPFNLAGLWLTRFFKDLKLTAGEAILKQPDPSTVTVTPTRKGVVDSTATIALIVGSLFTLISVISALWRISWAVPIVFLLSIILALLLASRIVSSGN